MITFLEVSPKNQDLKKLYFYSAFNQIWSILWMMDGAFTSQNWGEKIY
jgi:hypothetical protein